MSRRVVRAAFASEPGLLGAVAEVQRRGHRVIDVLAPYAVHGLPEALGLAPSRLPWVCLGAGVAGLLLGLAGQLWTSAVDWPVDVGGKPPEALPAYVPVAFELAVLFGGLAVVAAFLGRERSGRRTLPAALAGGATDDRLVLLLEARGAAYDAPALAALLRTRYEALDVSETLVEEDAA